MQDLVEADAKCAKLICKKRCEMREINMQKTVRNAVNLCAKNRAKCVKLICKKRCEMREINRQKTVRNAVNLCEKNRAKCAKLICEKHCEMRHFSTNFPYFLHMNLAYFSVFFAGNRMAIFHIFRAFS